MGNISSFFRRKDKKNEQKVDENQNQNENEKDYIDVIIDRYLGNETINIAFLPDFLERRFYKSILEILFREIKKLDGNVIGKIFEQDVVIRFENLDQNTNTLFFNENGNEYEQHKKSEYIEKVIQTFLENNQLPIEVPHFLQLQIYKTLLFLLLNIVHDTLRQTYVFFMNQKIKFVIENEEGQEEREQGQEGEGEGPRFNFQGNNIHDLELAERLAEEYMKTRNVYWFPDSIERKMYVCMLLIVFYFMNNIMQTTEVVFGHAMRLRMDLDPLHQDE